MTEKLQYLASVYHTEKMSQQVAELGRETEELQQIIRLRSQNLHDAAKVKKKISKFKLKRSSLKKTMVEIQCTPLKAFCIGKCLLHLDFRLQVLTDRHACCFYSAGYEKI